MILFLSKYLNNIDKKGRISIPAAFRSVITSQGSGSLVLYPSIKNLCIEGCSMKKLESMSKIIANLDPYSEERDAFETIILGQSTEVSFDNEGRIIIPKFLSQHAELSTQAVFVGKGEVFEIWNPQDFEQHLDKARSIAKANKSILKNL
jgi:MraZ protein